MPKDAETEAARKLREHKDKDDEETVESAGEKATPPSRTKRTAPARSDLPTQQKPKPGNYELVANEWNERGIKLGSLKEALDFGKVVIDSGCAPKGVHRPEQVVLSLQRGAELGLSPLSSLSNIPVINGRTTIMGDAAKALILQSGKLKEGMGVNEYIDGDPGDPESWVAYCKSWRRDTTTELVSSFSVAEAKLAGLWRKAGPWSQYPKRMLRYRALGFHVRDHYPDVILPGMYTTEEAMDLPLVQDVTPREEPTTDDPMFDFPKDRNLSDYNKDAATDAEVVEEG